MKTKVWVGGVKSHTPASKVEEAFSKYGTVAKVETGFPGMAFVEFDALKDAEEACKALDAKVLPGIGKLGCKIATERGYEDAVKKRDDFQRGNFVPARNRVSRVSRSRSRSRRPRGRSRSRRSRRASSRSRSTRRRNRSTSRSRTPKPRRSPTPLRKRAVETRVAKKDQLRSRSQPRRRLQSRSYSPPRHKRSPSALRGKSGSRSQSPAPRQRRCGP